MIPVPAACRTCAAPVWRLFEDDHGLDEWISPRPLARGDPIPYRCWTPSTAPGAYRPIHGARPTGRALHAEHQCPERTTPAMSASPYTGTAAPAADLDPFAGSQSNPAVSFKDATVGTTYTGTVIEGPKLVQSRDYETGEPAAWPDGNPKMSVVIVLDIDGETRSLWAAKPSALFAALGAAQGKAGARITEGGTLAVRYTGDVPNAKNPRLNPAKQYEAKYTPPAAPDAFAASGDSAPF